jgi:hypothetical protein
MVRGLPYALQSYSASQGISCLCGTGWFIVVESSSDLESLCVSKTNLTITIPSICKSPHLSPLFGFSDHRFIKNS